MVQINCGTAMQAMNRWHTAGMTAFRLSFLFSFQRRTGRRRRGMQTCYAAATDITASWRKSQRLFYSGLTEKTAVGPLNLMASGKKAGKDAASRKRYRREEKQASPKPSVSDSVPENLL